MFAVRLARLAVVVPSATAVQVAPLSLPLIHQAPLRLEIVSVAVVWVTSLAVSPTLASVLKVALASSSAALQPVAPYAL